eukprot:6212409-Pleurochrysis_carterae.AAC.2
MTEPAGGRATATFPHLSSPSVEARSGTGCEAGRCGRGGGGGSSRWCGTSRRGQGQHWVHLPARPTG